MKSSDKSKYRKFVELSFIKQLLLILGVFCVIWGLFFLYLSLSDETLSGGNKVEEVTEYIADKPKLSVGEIKVTKTTHYLKDAEYELIYKNYVNNKGNLKVLDKSSGIQITDILGTGYKVIDKSVVVNGKKYSEKSKIKVNTTDSIVRINIPHEMSADVNKIELKIKLSEIFEGMKYFTCKDAYYTIVPSDENKFYTKKTSQSYLIEGNGYIKIKNS